MRLNASIVILLLSGVFLTTASVQAAKTQISDSRYEAVTKGKSIAVGLLEKKKSGKLTKSFPDKFLGIWGGRLKIYRYDVLPLYKKLDSKMALKSVEHLKPGRTCSLNFNFEKNEEGNVNLTCSPGIVMVPAMSSNVIQNYFKSKGRGGQSDEKMAQMKALLSQKRTPIQLNFGSFKTDANLLGITGNQSSSKIYDDSLKKLGEDVFEKRVVLTSQIRVKSKKTKSSRLEETVFWVKFVDKQDYLYVRIAALEGTSKGQLLNRLVMAGNLVKGKKMETDAKAIVRQEFR